MSRLSLLSLPLIAGALLGGATAPATLAAQSPLSLSAHAPSAVMAGSEGGSPDAAQGSHAVAGDTTARAAGPWVSTAAVRTTTPATTDAAVGRDDPHVGAGKNLALMGVGAAAVAIGMLVGDAAGTGIAVGGGLIGLYGLYLFLR